MEQENDFPLTLEEEKLEESFADEDSNTIPFRRLDPPACVPLPSVPTGVVAVILPFRRRKQASFVTIG